MKLRLGFTRIRNFAFTVGVGVIPLAAAVILIVIKDTRVLSGALGALITLTATSMVWLYRRPVLSASIPVGGRSYVHVRFLEPANRSWPRREVSEMRWLRITVVNTGHRSATARAYLTYLQREDDDPIIMDEAIDLWGSAGGDGSASAPLHSLIMHRGVKRHFDIIYSHKKGSEAPRLLIPSTNFKHRHPGPDGSGHLKPGRYFIEAIVTAEGADLEGLCNR